MWSRAFHAEGTAYAQIWSCQRACEHSVTLNDPVQLDAG